MPEDELNHMLYSLLAGVELVDVDGGLVVEEIDNIVYLVELLELKLKIVAIGGCYREVVSKWNQRLVLLHQEEILIA